MFVKILVLSFCMLQINAAVTNEDIRLAILQIVGVVRNIDDKLERHEFREKLLGEQLKKGLINIDKRIKLLDPIKGTVSRIDERLASIETILMQKDRDDKIQQIEQQKINDAVIDLQKNLPIIIEQLNQDLSKKIQSTIPPPQIIEPTLTKDEFNKIERNVTEEIAKITQTVNDVRKEFNEIHQDDLHRNKYFNSSVMESFEKTKHHLSLSENILAKYENKLIEFNKKLPDIVQENDEWKRRFLTELQSQKMEITNLLNYVAVLTADMKQLVNRNEFTSIINNTLHKLEELNHNQQKPSETIHGNLDGSIIKETKELAYKNQEIIKQSFNELTEITSHLTESFTNNYENIRSEIKNFGKMEKVILQTADAIMDTKRRLEYGIMQIISEVGKQLKGGIENINQGITDRFDTFETSILDEDTGALQNITGKLQEEISRVWRQIGIMHQQMTTNTDTLNKLQSQTDSYVNGSMGVMDNMKGKVTEITGRMTEVDENLNFLLGKLSLLSQEFNRIKSGLGSTLDEIRSTFQNVQTNIVKNPNFKGPHKISSNEVLENAPN